MQRGNRAAGSLLAAEATQCMSLGASRKCLYGCRNPWYLAPTSGLATKKHEGAADAVVVRLDTVADKNTIASL
jgi:hypothetical protein